MGFWPVHMLDANICHDPAKKMATPRPLGNYCVQALGHCPTQPYSRQVCFLLPESVFSAGRGLSSVDAWCTTALDVEKCLGSDGDGRVHIVVSDGENHLTQLIRIFWIAS